MASLDGKAALVIGAGALGGSAVLTLAAGGVRRIVLADPAPVRPQDLPGNPLLREEDIGLGRGEAAARSLARRFPALTLEAAARTFDEQTGPALVASADVVVDASNHFPTMFLASDLSAAARRPLVHGGGLLYTVQLLTVSPGETGCFRCLFEGPPPPAASSAAEADVFGPLAGFAGTLMGAEALRVLEGVPGAYAGRLLVYEARSRRSRSVPVKLRPGCPGCSALVAARAAAGGGAS